MSDISSSSWCTNWEAYNTPRLWSMVAGEDDPEAWKQVIAWQEVSDAVDSHLARLKQARDTLETAWPTSQSEASRAFVTRLNTLITRMEGARQEASSTATALDHILQALRQAKQSIEPLWKQYRDKNEDVVPAWWDNAEEELDAQARAHMVAAEQVVQQYVPGIKVPGVYELVLLDNRESEEGGAPSSSKSELSEGGAGSSGDHISVPHNPPPPLPTHARADFSTPIVSDGMGMPNPSIPQLPNFDVPVLSPESNVDSNIIPPSGPELSEVLPLPSPSDPGPLSPPGVPPTQSAPSVNVLPRANIIPVGSRGGITPAGKAIDSRLSPFGRVSERSIPWGSSVVVGTPVAGSNSGSPNGRVRGINSDAKPSAPRWLAEPAGRSELASTGMPAAGRKENNGHDGQDSRFDPDNPWSVARGVDPIIEPSRKVPVHDPGAGVIGRRW